MQTIGNRFSNRRRLRLLCLYLLCAVPLIIYGALQAMQSNANSPLEWVPETFLPRAEYADFAERFGPGDTLIVGWDGCTIDQPDLDSLLAMLRGADRFHGADGNWLFFSASSGREVWQQLTRGPMPVDAAEAANRLRGLLIGPDGRTTCVLIAFTKDALQARQRVVRQIQEAVTETCHIPASQQHLAGPVIDGLSVDQAGKASLAQLAIPSAIVVLAIACFCLGSFRAALIVFGLSAFCQAATLALIHYAGQTMSALLIVLPPLIQVLAVAGGVHLTNYYYESWTTEGRDSAPWAAVQLGWVPILLSSGTTALGIGSLLVSSLTPIRNFAAFGAAGVLLTAGLLLTVVPLLWTIFPVGDAGASTSGPQPDSARFRRWSLLTDWMHRQHRTVLLTGLGLMVVIGLGVRDLKTSVRIETLFGPDSRIVCDYRWIEEHVGFVVPIEVVLQYDAAAAESASERLRRVKAVEDALRAMPEVGATLSALDFLPAQLPHSLQQGLLRRLSPDALVDANRPALIQAGRLWESRGAQHWRVTAYVSALEETDYGAFLHRVQDVVAPLLATSAERESVSDGRATVARRVGTPPLAGLKIQYTGIMPLVHEIQRQLMHDLVNSFLMALVLIATVMTLAQAGFAAGLIAMLPNVFPILLLFGLLGWNSVPLDIGTVMTASMALGIAVDDTLHFLTFFQRGMATFRSRVEAVRFAYCHCGSAMVQTSLICGLGLLVFAGSEFVPTSRFAWITASLLAAALAGDLLLLPALLISPLGRLFPSLAEPPAEATGLTDSAIPRPAERVRRRAS